MEKKKIIAFGMVIMMTFGILTGCGTSASSNDSQTSTESAETTQNSETNVEQAEESNVDEEENGKTLVVYFSAQGHTVDFAEAIAEELDADLFEITPVDVYTEEDLDWTNESSRVSREHDDESLRDIELTTTEVPNWDSYDTVYIGYPIWWGIAAWPVDNFVKDNDFTEKIVIPFCTSASSDIGESEEILKDYAGTGNWLEGKRFQSGEDTANAKEWAASISE